MVSHCYSITSTPHLNSWYSYGSTLPVTAVFYIASPRTEVNYCASSTVQDTWYVLLKVKINNTWVSSSSMSSIESTPFLSKISRSKLNCTITSAGATCSTATDTNLLATRTDLVNTLDPKTDYIPNIVCSTATATDTNTDTSVSTRGSTIVTICFVIAIAMPKISGPDNPIGVVSTPYNLVAEKFDFVTACVVCLSESGLI
ncbi:hypothetical protein PHYBLDRAFT_70881 [Phycomyces blakesleeanus NRRL 1555(-)]|uniref:Uncharacterized protein n=1 Tax=Phycomyces blakesleeanus (strain ATCC 8743b / DSM 1359 / FGSC 10004 / NBRC 33097 / NRRL 1555) TaxID=763407 RepID=A0A167JP75_PHYB8|nr:hypothetical protein PHYBLDRAFT_70881 [Phycomyces blakesleeanus NRRL 1555(-)]OAD66426.1 hypothetical protein PHYBLDRAFT_70881 [Phycomyces blakesleeanus NRRL 1555(-)]|eukprot:XP_018284466.1 hypothetical protein PHYBLDRAFT_70881 [Phycomyces blakesleeanus NRRL 1555(-)]